MLMLADLLTTEASRPGASDSLRWIADVSPRARRATFADDDLARINGYVGGASDLHGLLPAVLPLSGPVWYETTIAAQHGTELTMAYVADPARGGIDVGVAVYAPAYGRIIGPLGPVRVTSTEMVRPPEMTDEGWREIRSATGIILRALLLGL